MAMPTQNGTCVYYGSRGSRFRRFFEILGGAGDVNTSISMPNYCNGPYIPLLPCANKVIALGPRFGKVLLAQVEGFASRRSFWTDFRDFEILGGAGDINNSTSTLNY